MDVFESARAAHAAERAAYESYERRLRAVKPAAERVVAVTPAAARLRSAPDATFNLQDTIERQARRNDILLKAGVQPRIVNHKPDPGWTQAEWDALGGKRYKRGKSSKRSKRAKSSKRSKRSKRR